jgi:hypothetical protein
MSTKYRIKKNATGGYDVTQTSSIWTRTVHQSNFWNACKEVWRLQGMLR